MTDMPSDVFEARYCQGIPTDCCDYGVISHATGKEVCRVWDRSDAERIANLLNAALTDHQSAGEPVAWMYERNGVRVLHEKHKPDYVTPAMGYTETPLYAAPQPAPAHAATLQKLAEEREARLISETCAVKTQEMLMEVLDAEKAKLAKARDGLEKAQRQFRFYADEHDAKAKAAKEAVDDALYWGNVAEQEAAGAEWQKRAKQAKTNHDFATMLADTLAQIGEEG